MRRYLPYVAVTLLAAACTNAVPGTSAEGHGTTASADGGNAVVVDPVTGEPVGTPMDPSASTGGSTAGPGAVGSGGGSTPDSDSNPDPVVPTTPLANCETPGLASFAG
jgi:hypothetical protein